MKKTDFSWWLAPLVMVLAGAFPGFARAELAWAREQVVLGAEPGAGTVLAAFPFQNTGKQAVTITGVATSCGCTGTTLAKKTWAAGERGELVARYFAGERAGVYGVEIVVTTDDGARPKALHLRAVVAAVATIQPTLAFWKADEPLAAKRLALKMREKTTAQAVTATSSNAQVAVQVMRGKDGAAEALLVTPQARGQKATLEITLTMPDGKTRVLKAFVKS